MNQEKLKDTFSTFDLALAAAISLYYPLETIDRSQDSRRVLFIFSRNQKLSELVDRYWKKELLVEPRQYFDQIKAMKARLYSND